MIPSERLNASTRIGIVHLYTPNSVCASPISVVQPAKADALGGPRVGKRCSSLDSNISSEESWTDLGRVDFARSALSFWEQR